MKIERFRDHREGDGKQEPSGRRTEGEKVLAWAHVILPTLVFLALRMLFSVICWKISMLGYPADEGSAESFRRELADAASACLLAPGIVAWAWRRREWTPGKASVFWCVLWSAAACAAAMLARLMMPELLASNRFCHPLIVCGEGLAGPVMEEFVYRGVAFDRARRLIGKTGAVFITALLFAAAHSGGGTQALFALIMGCVFGMMRICSGGVLLPAAAHVLINLSTLL